ncbi:hypothetical protein IKG31_00360 [Candidatus Saccharibacteria bacterium]|nr:hypothetical protein [Candidatus Saccharibacteria bacterium]
MIPFDMNEYSEGSRKVLKKVVEEIREQFLVNGRSCQFWFHPTQVGDETLTEPIILKWLRVLSEKNLLHFYRPNNTFEYEQSLALCQGHLGEDYGWNPQMMVPFVSGFPPDSFPAIALDIYDTDLDQLIESVLKKKLYGKFQKDNLGSYYYDGALLTGINNSPLREAVLEEFLLADEHTVSAKGIEGVISRFRDEVDDPARNDAISETKKALRDVSHEIDIASHKAGRRVDYYELIVGQAVGLKSV